MRNWFRVLAVLIGVSITAAAETALPEPFPATRAAAEATGLRFGDFDEVNGESLTVGDHALALVTLVDGKKEKQWLVRLEVAEPTPDERKHMQTPPPLKLYSDSGRVLEFKGAIALIELRTWGPFSPGAPPKKLPAFKKARTGVNSEHLMLGFARGCSSILRISAAIHEHPDGKSIRPGFNYRGTPFSAEEIAIGSRTAELAKVSQEDEKALAASFPAIYGFFGVALQSPGLQEILTEVVDIPLWSIVKGGGKVNPSFFFDGQHIRILSGTTAPGDTATHYALPARLSLNDKPALDFTLEVRPPESPYSSTAGILALSARHPKKEDKRATIHVVSAKRAERISGQMPQERR